MTESKTVGALAQQAGVNIETIRYYERRGLLKKPSRGASRWRRYDEDAVRTVVFVKRAQRLGFTLDEISELLKLRASKSERACSRVQTKARQKLDEIDEKIRDLEAMRAALASLSRRCAPDDAGSCPVLDALIESEENDDD